MMWRVMVAVCLAAGISHAQRAGFDVRLDVDLKSAEKTIELFEGRSGSPRDVASLRGSRIALATTALLSGQRLSPADLEQALEDAKFGHSAGESVFRMDEGREHTQILRELLTEIRRRNFARRVASTVEALFPADTRLSATIPVYVVAFGHQNIEAFVRRVVWRGDVPVFVGEGEGELTIVVNIAKAVNYGRTVEERFIGVLSLVAHEVFHAAFGVYQDNSPVWREYRDTHRTYLDQLLELTQNEGIAHYLSFEQRTGGAVPRDWDERVRASFGEFNTNAEILLSGRVSPARAGEIIRASNTSEYWQSYGAITGLSIARQIDRVLGRPALVETITLGPADFFAKYHRICRTNSNLPGLSPRIIDRLK